MEKYVPIEYPKWVDGVVFQNAAEERALKAAQGEAAALARAAELARPPSRASIRMGRSRERRREGKLSIRCDISSVQREALANAGFIDPTRRNDPAEVAQAVGRSLDRLTPSGQGAIL